MEIIKTVVWCQLLSVVFCVVSGRPNILIFLADDFGIGDVGIYGNTTLRTPNIDKIGKEGTKLTHHVTAASVCSPSRAALLTGRYPIRSEINAVLPNLAIPRGLPPDEITIAEQAKAAGYNTALIGKWHLGLYDIWRNFTYHPLNQGFGEFYGLLLSNVIDFGNTSGPRYCSWGDYLPQIVIMYFSVAIPILWLFKASFQANKWYKLCFIFGTLLYCLHYIHLYHLCTLNSVLMRDYDVIEQPIRLKGLTGRFVKESVGFLERQRDRENPFFLFVSWHHTHTYLDPVSQFAGKTPHGQYGDCVEEMDWGIGEILAALDSLGHTDNTLVYFTSDNGGHIEEAVNHNGGYNGIYRGGKSWGAVEGGIRVPGLIRWPGKISPNSVINEPTSLMDIFPTLSSVMGAPLPENRRLDGFDILPLLQNESRVTPHEYIMHYCLTDIHAVTYRPRNGNTVWKVAYRFPDDHIEPEVCINYPPFIARVCSCHLSKTLDTPLIFDLTSDPGEAMPINVNSNYKYTDILSKVNAAVETHKSTLTRQEKLPGHYWMPHLQVCCNFPICRCNENT